jgi:hypothetical protein
MHKPTPSDVRAAFEKYKRITGDNLARLIRTEPEHGATIYETEGAFEGRWYGAASALLAIESYCSGYKDGQDDGAADALQREEVGPGAT